MNNKKIFSALLIVTFIMLAGCTFIGGVFKTGVGVGVFMIVALIIIVLIISRIGKRNKVG